MEEVNNRLFPNLKWSNSEPKVGTGFTISQNDLHYWIEKVDDENMAYKKLIDKDYKTNEVTKLEGGYYIVSFPLIS